MEHVSQNEMKMTINQDDVATRGHFSVIVNNPGNTPPNGDSNVKSFRVNPRQTTSSPTPTTTVTVTPTGTPTETVSATPWPSDSPCPTPVATGANTTFSFILKPLASIVDAFKWLTGQ